MSSSYQYDLIVKFDYFSNAKQETQIENKIQSIITSLDLTEKSDIEKIITIHDYILDNVEYDYEHYNDETYFNQFTPYGALIDGLATCEGYATTFYRICETVGINTKIVAGENHAWNLVEIDDKYYNIDTTWDDSNSDKYKYYLKCNNHFQNHTRYNKYNTTEFNQTYAMSDYCYNDSECCEEIFDDNATDFVSITNETPAITEHSHSNLTFIISSATLTNNGSVQTVCDDCNEVLSTSKISKIKSVYLAKTTYTYNGKVKKPSITVKDSSGKTISNSYYSVTYQKGRKNVGEYTVKVKFKGNYSGIVKKSFTIKPKKTSVSKITKNSNSLTVKWKKQTTQVTGYQIKYSTSKSFKNAKTLTINSAKTTSKKIKNLKSNKKYYVKIRTYKTVDGKKYYSSWSVTKLAKTK